MISENLESAYLYVLQEALRLIKYCYNDIIMSKYQGKDVL